MKWIRRLRGLTGLAVTGAISWVPLGLIAVSVEAIVRGRGVPWSRFPRFALLLAMIGASCGLVVGILVLILERRKSFGGLSLGRMALWGAVGGLAIPLVLVNAAGARANVAMTVVNFCIYGSVGALMSAGIFAIARRAPSLSDEPPPKELPHGRA